jgi:hypothetical protein
LVSIPPATWKYHKPEKTNIAAMEHGFTYPEITPGARRRLAKMRRQLFPATELTSCAYP